MMVISLNVMRIIRASALKLNVKKMPIMNFFPNNHCYLFILKKVAFSYLD